MSIGSGQDLINTSLDLFSQIAVLKDFKGMSMSLMKMFPLEISSLEERERERDVLNKSRLLSET